MAHGEQRVEPDVYRIVVPPELAIDGRALTASMTALGMTVTREPAQAETGEGLQPVWVSVDDFTRWAATKAEYSESEGGYFGTRAWNGVLRVAIDAAMQGRDPDLVLSRYPDDLSTWSRYRNDRDDEFGQLDLRSMEAFISQLRQSAGARRGRVLETFITGKLPLQVGFGTFKFWDEFTRDKMREVRRASDGERDDN